jgi:beta-fructofuranosidase
MKLFLTITVLLIQVGSIAQDTLGYWQFEMDTREVRTIRKGSQLVNGIRGQGLRTDGYSTHAEFNIPQVDAPLFVNGWFAPESFSTDTSGFFSILDTLTGYYVTAGMDKFGTPILGIYSPHGCTYKGGQTKLEKFKWINVELSIVAEEIIMFINKIPVCRVSTGDDLNFNRLIIGKDKRDKFVGIFPVTYFNGIVDQLLMTRTRHVSDVEGFGLPNLAIPSGWFKDDFNRPAYHLLPASNWTNETHGLLFHKGRYHIFNQKNATNVFLGQINWGHFSSSDLVNWTEHIPALTPEPGYDEKGAWSGHVVVRNDTPVIVYTGGGKDDFNMCLAFPADPMLINWIKYKGNPAVAGAPAGWSRNDPHDPYVWKEGETWYMVVGFGIIERNIKKGTAILYKSHDLISWEYLHPFFTGNPEQDDSGDFWEMPVVWKLNGKYVFLVNKVPSAAGPAVALYWIGNFVNEKFVPDHIKPHKLEVVNRMLSPSVNFDENGLTTAIAIIPDETSAEAQYRQGWTHVYSIPRTWKLVNGRIAQAPHPALNSLRTNKRIIEKRLLNEGSALEISKNNHQLEFILKAITPATGKFGFNILKNPTGKEGTQIIFDTQNDEIIVDQSGSTVRSHIPRTIRKGSYNFVNGHELRVHFFIDGSVVEVFINDTEAFTTRIFPNDIESNVVELFAGDTKLEIKNIDVWSLKKPVITADFRLQSNNEE